MPALPGKEMSGQDARAPAKKIEADRINDPPHVSLA